MSLVMQRIEPLACQQVQFLRVVSRNQRLLVDIYGGIVEGRKLYGTENETKSNLYT